eukprot:TRINITY_DN9248_c0_g7_i1.p1 TRINITY_DN9248_c0_g7~~TRINITY_DN9248_c0_g7_i1.p1  ORF type:complete len:547 (-),score=110.82 TRINITY_DN9248_c0_g7_i1:1426-3021(-)
MCIRDSINAEYMGIVSLSKYAVKMRTHQLQREQPAYVPPKDKNLPRSQSPKKNVQINKLTTVKSQANLHNQMVASVLQPEEDQKPDFRAEIERRFKKSETNRIFVFPRLFAEEGASDTSLESLTGIGCYDLHSQNEVEPARPSRTRPVEVSTKISFVDRSGTNMEMNNSGSAIHSKNESVVDVKTPSVCSENNPGRQKYKKLLDVLHNNLKKLYEEAEMPPYEQKPSGAQTSGRKLDQPKLGYCASTSNLNAGRGTTLRPSSTTADLSASGKFIGMERLTESMKHVKPKAKNGLTKGTKQKMTKVYSTALLKSVNLAKEISSSPKFVTDRESKMGTSSLYMKTKSIVAKAQKTPKNTHQTAPKPFSRYTDKEDHPLRQVDNFQSDYSSYTTVGREGTSKIMKINVGESVNLKHSVSKQSLGSSTIMSKVGSLRQLDMMSPKQYGTENRSQGRMKWDLRDENGSFASRYVDSLSTSNAGRTNLQRKVEAAAKKPRNNEFERSLASNSSKDGKSGISKSKPTSAINSKRVFGK